uniref:Uncharacterized protein n=1 Tax=Rhizophora mucronata TaxID=61149 RepID=A0A2P2NPK0_RHIMU
MPVLAGGFPVRLRRRAGEGEKDRETE